MGENMKKRNPWITILMPLLGGIIVSLVIAPSMNYSTLNKPILSPPGIVFPIVWTILYLLMGISYYLSETSNHDKFQKSSIIFYISLFLNYLWPIFFFTLNLPTVAFVIILLLIYTVILWITRLFKETKIASYLQIPYLVWLFFALYLNLAIIILN